MIVKVSFGNRFFLLTLLQLAFLSFAMAQEAKRFIGSEENLGQQINTAYDESVLKLSPDGRTMYFTRSRHPENMGGRNDPGDIWISKMDENGQWSQAVNAGEKLNNVYYNAVIGFSPRGNTMYLQHHYFERGLRPKTQGISFSTKQGDNWSFPKKLDVDNFFNSSSHQSACISADGKILIMAINSFGSYGYEDLFVSFKSSDGSWTAPKNMGNTLNTTLQEMTPFLSADNTTLYFASSGHNSLGSRDIFVSKRLDHSWRVWSEPENVTELNSEGVELSYIITPDEEYAYFISTRNSDGYGDINRIKLNPAFEPPQIAEENTPEFAEPDTVILISQTGTAPILQAPKDTAVLKEERIKFEGIILNKKTRIPVSGKINFRPFGNQSSQSGAISPTINEGMFSVNLRKGSQYRIRVSAEGYMTEETVLNLISDTVSLNKEFFLTPLETGTTYQLNNVLFERGTANLVDSAYAELDRVHEMLVENPQISIEIAGHTDNQGDARLNLKLSQERVETVLQYLRERGINKDRLIGRGYGGTRPIASNKSESTRKLNRRVEFTILEGAE